MIDQSSYSDITTDLEKISRKVEQLKGKRLSVDDSAKLVMYEEIQAELKGRLRRIEREAEHDKNAI